MPSTRRQKAKTRKSRELDMMSDLDNLDIMPGSGNGNPIDRVLASAIEHSSVQWEIEEKTHQRSDFEGSPYENVSLRQNDFRHFFETFTNEFNLRLPQEMNSMMCMVHSQIIRAINTAIAERVIPEI